MSELTDSEFGAFQRFIMDRAGIALPGTKKALVTGRLMKRLHERGLPGFAGYLRLLRSPGEQDEIQTAVDLLTTNETYFFREPAHFELLRRLARQSAGRRRRFRAWSAASSSGEEAYSMAMVLAEELGIDGFEVVGTDISTRVLERAIAGHYPMDRTDGIPLTSLRRWCLRGHGRQHGTLLVARELRARVDFQHMNLNEALPAMAPFDVIFLRNVLIYFNPETKRQVVQRLLQRLAPGGHLVVGHSESLTGLVDGLAAAAPSVYVRAAPAGATA